MPRAMRMQHDYTDVEALINSGLLITYILALLFVAFWPLINAAWLHGAGWARVAHSLLWCNCADETGYRLCHD